MKKPQLAAFAFLGLLVFGCTSLLGDYEVGSSGGTCTPGTPGCTAEGCTTGQNKCGDVCIDTQTNNQNCGACGRACPSGLSCAAGNCQCPDQGAFCDGQCFPRTDREHCGVTCSKCDGNQVCDGRCTDPPAPLFDKVPRSATGWKDTANAAITVTMKPTGQPGTVYECRTGPVANFTDTTPAWGNCDGASGANPTHTPAEAPGTPEGTYATEYRYKLGPYTSPAIRARYYVHKSLDGVATCPRVGVPVDGPHFTDAQYFAAAEAFAAANPTEFPTTTAFPAGGESREDAIYLGNPWIKIPFTKIHESRGMRSGTIDGEEGYDPWPANGADYLFNERSLRHRYALNAARNLVLVVRQYIHPKTNDCKQTFDVGNVSYTQFGPPGRSNRKQECEAFVLNANGAAICLMPDGKTPAAPAPVPADSRISVAGEALTGPFQVFGGSPTVLTTNDSFKPTMVGGFLKLPNTQFGRWYQIQSVTNAKAVILTENVNNSANNVTGAFTATATPAYVFASGFPKLHQDGHSWATGGKRIPTGPGGTKITGPRPSHRTKCDTAGCNTGKPWLTYLSP